MAVDLTVPIPAAADWFVGMIDQAKIQAYISDYIEELRQSVVGGTPTTPSLSANWTNLSGAAALQYKTRGLDQVWIFGAATRATINLPADGNWTTNPIFTFPAGLRPSSIWHIYADASTGTGVILQCRINTDGTVQVRNIGTAAMAVGDNININGVFLLG